MWNVKCYHSHTLGGWDRTEFWGVKKRQKKCPRGHLSLRITTHRYSNLKSFLIYSTAKWPLFISNCKWKQRETGSLSWSPALQTCRLVPTPAHGTHFDNSLILRYIILNMGKIRCGGRYLWSQYWIALRPGRSAHSVQGQSQMHSQTYLKNQSNLRKSRNN